MITSRFVFPLALPLAALVAGCSSSSSNYGSVVAKTTATTLVVCHGFDCRRQTKLHLSAADQKKLAGIMASGATSAAAERAAVASAIAYFETRAGQAIGVKDTAKSTIAQSGLMGQMDCIDESTNSRTLLLHLQNSGLLKHHSVRGNVSRGFFADGRYPHSTAVLRDKSGTDWAVDSWYEPMGGKPDVMLLSQWKTRGVMGER